IVKQPTLVDEIAELIHGLAIKVNNIEKYAKDLETKDSDQLRKQLKTLRFNAKNDVKVIVEKIKERELNGNFKDNEKQLFTKLKKQCAQIIKKFEEANKKSLKKEREIFKTTNQKLIEKQSGIINDIDTYTEYGNAASASI